MFDPRVQFASEDDRLAAKVEWNSINVQWAKDAIASGMPLKRGASPFLKNNVEVRAAGLNFAYSEEERQEFIRCKMDILHFAEKYCKLVGDTGKVGSIKLRRYQKRLLRSMQTKKLVIILSGRQIGKTTTTAIFLLWKLLFHREESIALLGDKAATAIENLNKIKSIMNNLPFFLKPGLYGINVGSMSLENGSRIFTGACTKSALVGKTLTCLYIDELDIPIEKQSRELVEYALPTIAAIKTGQAIFSSTPSVGGIFKDLFFGALERRNQFHAEQVNWWEVPGRDLEWKQMMLRTYGKDAFNVQFNCRFLSSTNTIFAEDFIEYTERSKKKYVPYKDMFDDSEDLHIQQYIFDFINASGRQMLKEDEPIDYLQLNREFFEANPEAFKNNFILITADLAEGIGSDDTILNFWNLKIEPKIQKTETEAAIKDFLDAMVDDVEVDFEDVFEDYNISIEQIAMFKSNMHSLKTVAYFARNFITKKMDCDKTRISVEYNKYGESFFNYMLSEHPKLEQIELETIARTEFAGKSKAGVHLSSATKKIYVPNAKSDLETGRININELVTINQMKYFGMAKNGTYAAAPGFKDDIIMTIVNASAFIDKTNESYVSWVEEALDDGNVEEDDSLW